MIKVNLHIKWFISEANFFSYLISFVSLTFSLAGRFTVLFSFNRNAAFFTNVSHAQSVSAMWFKDRPRFLYIITLRLSEIANYFVIITERLYLTTIEPGRETDTKWTRLLSWKHLIDVHQNLVLKWEKIVEGRVWLITAVMSFRRRKANPSLT